MFWNAVITIVLLGITYYLFVEGMGKLKRGRGAKTTKDGRKFFLWGVILLLITGFIVYYWILYFINALWESTVFVSNRWFGTGNYAIFLMIGIVIVLFTSLYLIVQKPFTSKHLFNISVLFRKSSPKDYRTKNRQIASQPQLKVLVQKLNSSFSLDELKDICFGINDIDFENLAGEEKKAKMRDLVMKLNRRGRLKELLQICQDERPLVSWQDI